MAGRGRVVSQSKRRSRSKVAKQTPVIACAGLRHCLARANRSVKRLDATIPARRSCNVLPRARGGHYCGPPQSARMLINSACMASTFLAAHQSVLCRSRSAEALSLVGTYVADYRLLRLVSEPRTRRAVLKRHSRCLSLLCHKLEAWCRRLQTRLVCFELCEVY